MEIIAIGGWKHLPAESGWKQLPTKSGWKELSAKNGWTQLKVAGNIESNWERLKLLKVQKAARIIGSDWKQLTADESTV